MSLSLILLVLGLAAVGWGSVTAARMGSELSRRGEKVNWALMRIAVLRWVGRYRDVTTAESGRPGPLHRQLTIAMPLALVLVLLGLLARR